LASRFAELLQYVQRSVLNVTKCQPNVRQLTTWQCPHFPAARRCCGAAAAARLLLTAGRAAIDRYLLPAGPAAANPSQRTGQTDGHPTVT